MARVTILGGCGVVGTAATKILARVEDFSEVIVADLNGEKARKLAVSLGSKVHAVQFDVNNKSSLEKAISGSDVVVNCVGPFYKFEKPILQAVIDAGIDYVDVNDDVGATHDALALDEAAKDANITALIGMGSSPGVTNLLAAYAVNELLDECESIDMYHTHGGEPHEGAAVIGHRFYCMTIDVPMFLEGKAIEVKQEESANYVEEVEFINLEGTHRVYPYPHPEPITLPRYLEHKGLKRVTNKGSVLPEEYYNLTRTVHQCGLSSKEPLMVKGTEVIPHDFAIAYLIRKRDQILQQVNFGEQRGCVKIVCRGLKKGTREPRTYIFSLVSEGAGKGQALGEATGIPAAFGAILMARGKINGRGVLPPEACVDPMEFLSLMGEVLSIDRSGSDATRGSPVIFESIDKAGNVRRMEF